MKDTDSEQPWKDFLTWGHHDCWECVELRQMVCCAVSRSPCEQRPVLCLCLIDPVWTDWLILSCSFSWGCWLRHKSQSFLLHSLKSNSFMRYNFLRLFIDLFGYPGLSWDMQDFSCDILIFCWGAQTLFVVLGLQSVQAQQLCHGDTIFNLFLLDHCSSP